MRHAYSGAVCAGPDRRARLPDTIRCSPSGAVPLPDTRANYDATVGDDRSLPALRAGAGRDAAAGCPGRRAALPAGANLSADTDLPTGADLPAGRSLRSVSLPMSVPLPVAVSNV
jgi:hypothetical protein